MVQNREKIITSSNIFQTEESEEGNLPVRDGTKSAVKRFKTNEEREIAVILPDEQGDNLITQMLNRNQVNVQQSALNLAVESRMREILASVETPRRNKIEMDKYLPYYEKTTGFISFDNLGKYFEFIEQFKDDNSEDNVESTLSKMLELYQTEKRDEKFRIEMLTLNPNFKNRVFQVFYSRLLNYLDQFQTEKTKMMNIQGVSGGIYRLLNKFEMSHDEESERLLGAHLINCSRALIDPNVEIERIGNIFRTVLDLFNMEKNVTLDQALQFFQNTVLKSEAFTKGLNKILDDYNNEMPTQLVAEKAIEMLAKLEVKIVQNSAWHGMVGFGTTIYINENLFTGSIKTESMVLKVIIHESIHLVLRYFCDNYLEITPMCGNTVLPCYEGGFRFETYLFGVHDLDILQKPYVEDLLNTKTWNSSIPLFIKDKNQDYPKRKVSNFHCSGLLLMNEDELELREM